MKNWQSYKFIPLYNNYCCFFAVKIKINCTDDNIVVDFGLLDGKTSFFLLKHFLGRRD